MPYTCFVVQRTNRWRRTLRRFRWSEACGDGCRCDEDASPWIEELDEVIVPSPSAAEARAQHAGWPEKCSRCGRAFEDSDQWQIAAEQLWRTDLGLELTRYELPPGATFQAYWLEDWEQHNPAKRAGGPWFVVLPDGIEWNVEGPATNGGYWTITGDAPRITANPSIASPGYHGWLRDGVLTDDVDGRTPEQLAAARARR